MRPGRQIYEHFEEAQEGAEQVAPPDEQSLQMVVSRIDAVNNKLMRASKTLPGSPRNYRDYKDYLAAVPEVQRLYLTITRDHNVAPCVAAYVIFRTDAAAIDLAIDYMFERREGDNRYRHPYFGYLPSG
mmetsp:Transcript_1304/g.1767  ORF Transcript_1304/g.1767 Transcript_1304/m.1767 type:complete len:129 (-) Transcript_1304:1658-2044(-)